MGLKKVPSLVRCPHFNPCKIGGVNVPCLERCPHFRGVLTEGCFNILLAVLGVLYLYPNEISMFQAILTSCLG